MTPDVELNEIVKMFGSTSAVNRVSFSVEPGQFFSLLGPSGCGKSTLLRIISGFERPDAGELFIGGDDVRHTPPHRRPTALVFQRWALFPHLTVTENIAFGMKVRREPSSSMNSRVNELLELVGLGGFGARKPSQLSGGQQQRVAIARALAIRPKVLLLDEPLSSLDLKLRLQMQVELKRLQREVGTTFIFVTHDQSEAMTMSDAIAVINHGQVEQLGSPKEIYDKPATQFVAGFIGDTNLISGRVDADTHSIVVGRNEARVLVPSGAPVQSDGQAVSLSIRYERIKLADAVSGPNQFRARVLEVIFSGAAVRYTVQLEGTDIRLTADVPHDGVTPIYPQGSEVCIGWQPEAAVVLTA